MKILPDLEKVVDKVLNTSTNFYRNKLARLLTQLVVLFVCGIYVYRYSSEIINLAKELQINYSRVIFAFLILSIVYLFVGTTSWWCILKGLGEDPGWINSANIQLRSTLAKYIPGYIWQYVGKAVMSKEIGINSIVSGTAMVFELVLTLIIGIGVAFISYSTQTNLDISGFNQIREIALPLGIVIILGTYISIWIFPHIMPRSFRTNSIHPWYLFASLLLITLGWIMLSITYWLIGSSLSQNITTQEIVIFFLATSMAIVGGILVILVPNGLGVRESIMVLVLGNIISIPLAILFSAITRLLVTVCELSSALIMGLLYRYMLKRKREFL